MTHASVAPDAAHSGHEKVSLSRVIHSEWIKFRSLRSTWISIAAALVAAIGLGILFSALRASHFAAQTQGPHGLPAGHPAVLHGGLDPTMISLRGLFLAQLAIGVLGVLLITGEYATGMIRGSLTAVPRRHPILLGKAVVFAASTFVIATAASLVAFLGGQAALNAQHLGVSLSSPGAARAVIGGGLYLMIVGLLGLGCGFLIRSTGGAIAALFGLILVLPLLANALPTSWQNDINPYLPLNAGSALMSTVTRAHTLSPWTGGAVFAAYAVVALGFGLLMLLRRDA